MSSRVAVRPRRVGIYVGAFDPVHSGHISFALQSLEEAELDQVVFLPERRPYSGRAPEHFAHRIAMLKAALAPHPRLRVLEVVDGYFTYRRTMPHLRSLYKGSTLVFLTGAEDVRRIERWPYAPWVFRETELLVAVSDEQQKAAIRQRLKLARLRPRRLYLVCNPAADVSSDRVRQALRGGVYTKGLLASVQRYARREWLYVSPVKQSQ